MKRIVFAIALISLTVISCKKEVGEVKVCTPGMQMASLAVGFEGNDNVDAKTYMAWTSDNMKARVSWYNYDKKIIVWDSNGVRNVFTGTVVSNMERYRTFSGEITAGSEIAYVLYDGTQVKNDEEPTGSYENGKFYCSIPTGQNQSTSRSFSVGANPAIMKGEDTALKNCAGYLGFKWTDEVSTPCPIKTLKISALTEGEYLAGDIEIDYSGDEPVVTLSSKQGSVKYSDITTAPRKKTIYEGGDFYICVVPGTYHGLKLEITPFDEAVEPFTIKTGNEFTVKRGEITAFDGILPSEPLPNGQIDTPEPSIEKNKNVVTINLNKTATEKYTVEVYNDKDMTSLYGKYENLTQENLPLVITFPETETSYWYKVQALDIEGVRVASEWATGKIDISMSEWPRDITAVDWDGEKYVDFSATRNFNIDGVDYTCDYKYLVSVYGNAQKILENVTFNKITYTKDCNFNSDKFTTGGKVYTSSDILTISGLYIPQNQRHAYFTICKPGTLTVQFKTSSTKEAHVTVALVTKKGGNLSAKYLMDASGLTASAKTDVFSLPVTKEDLEGIEEPAKIMFFDGANLAALIVYPPTWTTAKD